MKQIQQELNQIYPKGVQDSGSTPPEATSSSLEQDCEDCHKPFEVKTKSELEWKKKCLKCY